MKDLLARLTAAENEMDEAEQAQDAAEESGDYEKAAEYEVAADSLYEKVFQLTEEGVRRIARITNGQISEPMARTMLRTKRAELERIFG